jgi:predicted anti-sigma-YlaC factor YlaD
MAAHPERELIPFLRGELDTAAREGVARHLEGCGACRAALDDAAGLLRDLARTVPAPPEIHWGRYRAEVRERLEARRTARASWRRWLTWPVPVAASAALAAALLLVTLLPLGPGVQRGPQPLELGALEETAIGSRLDLLENFGVLERLDLLENLDVIHSLDRLAVRES